LGPGTVTNFNDNIAIHPSFESAPNSGNRVVNLTATQATFGGYGILIDGSNSNTVITSTSDNNTGGGILLAGGHDNIAIANTASGNAFEGIGLYSDIANGPTNDIVRANHTDRNGSYGIHIGPTSGGNLIQANKAHGNTLFDLDDENSGCDSNTWKSNSFNTANQPCIH